MDDLENKRQPIGCPPGLETSTEAAAAEPWDSRQTKARDDELQQGSKMQLRV